MPRELMYFKAGETLRSEDIAVWVNGVPLPMCTEANVIECWARTYVESEDGGIRTDAFGNKILATLRGAVVIRLSA